MTDTMIREQILTIREATKKAAKSKASALKFLMEAGIITKPATASAKKKK